MFSKIRKILYPHAEVEVNGDKYVLYVTDTTFGMFTVKVYKIQNDKEKFYSNWYGFEGQFVDTSLEEIVARCIKEVEAENRAKERYERALKRFE